MKQAVEVFDGYGDRELLEENLNAWLRSEPRHVVSLQATESRIFIRWRTGNGNHRHAPPFFKIFSTMSNGGAPGHRFREFFDQHPNANVVAETCNDFFLVWLWVDETG